MILTVTISQLITIGGVIPVILLTILMAAIFFSARKAPRWVKNIGSIALACSVLASAINFARAAEAVIACQSNISPAVVWAGIRCAAVLLSYGLIVFIVSRIVDMIQKPRI